jgi:hypothetical protein
LAGSAAAVSGRGVARGAWLPERARVSVVDVPPFAGAGFPAAGTFALDEVAGALAAGALVAADGVLAGAA